MFCLQKIGITREKGTIEKNMGLKPGLEPGFLGMQVIVQEEEEEEEEYFIYPRLSHQAYL